MPLLYGEGNEAFIRLQLEVMKISDDDSLFAWANNHNRHFYTRFPGLLAPSPAAFQFQRDVMRGSSRSITPCSMTNKGLHISLTLIPVSEALEKGIRVFADSLWTTDIPAPVDNLRSMGIRSSSSALRSTAKRDQFVAPLVCYTEDKSLGEERSVGRNHVLLHLGRVTEDNGRIWYMRLFSDILQKCSPDVIPSKLIEYQIFVPQRRYFPRQTNPEEPILKFPIRAGRSFGYEFAFSSLTDDHQQLDHAIKTGGPADIVDLERRTIVEFGLRTDSITSSGISVEFKGLNGPRGLQEAFILQIEFGPRSDSITRSGVPMEFKGLDGPPGLMEAFISMQINRQLRSAPPSVGIILLAPNGKSLVEISKEPRDPHSYTQRDRDTLAFSSTHVISAALRKQGGRNGELMYVVDLDIK